VVAEITIDAACVATVAAGTAAEVHLCDWGCREIQRRHQQESKKRRGENDEFQCSTLTCTLDVSYTIDCMIILSLSWLSHPKLPLSLQQLYIISDHLTVVALFKDNWTQFVRPHGDQWCCDSVLIAEVLYVST
jgi:hypothetical protein